jgi:aryl-alcohol dehydrogenase-like predicted oxidoreductase
MGTDYVDLWQLHSWDPEVPLDETLSAVDLAVSSGRVRYAGVANYAGWQLAAAARSAGLPLVSVQSEYSLLERGVEDEVLPAATYHGMGLLPWGPLGRGVLTGKYRDGTPHDSRGASAHLGPYVGRHRTDRAARIVQAVVTAAHGLGTSPLAVALAWVRDRPGVVAPIVGARTAQQLQASLDADGVRLPAAIRTALEDVSAPPFSYPERRAEQ